MTAQQFQADALNWITTIGIVLTAVVTMAIGFWLKFGPAIAKAVADIDRLKKHTGLPDAPPATPAPVGTVTVATAAKIVPILFAALFLTACGTYVREGKTTVYQSHGNADLVYFKTKQSELIQLNIDHGTPTREAFNGIDKITRDLATLGLAFSPAGKVAGAFTQGANDFLSRPTNRSAAATPKPTPKPIVFPVIPQIPAALQAK